VLGISERCGCAAAAAASGTKWSMACRRSSWHRRRTNSSTDRFFPGKSRDSSSIDGVDTGIGDATGDPAADSAGDGGADGGGDGDETSLGSWCDSLLEDVLL